MTIEPDIIGQHIRDGIRAEFAPLFDDLRRFTDRRIAELSAEINATVQLVDFSETNLSNQLGKIHEQIASVVSMPAAATRNSGLELEAVVQATEAAANQIMEAAEAIGDWLRDGNRDGDGLDAVAERLNSIFEACSFQDVTGQRVRRAIQHLQQVESMLTDLLPPGQDQSAGSGPSAGANPGLDPAPDRGPNLGPDLGPDLGQDAVDRLFG